MHARQIARPASRIPARRPSGIRLVGPASEPDPAVEALRILARVLAPYLREVLAAQQTDDDVVEIVAIVPLPKRRVFAACRRGEIEGAVRKARRWFARRADVLAWLNARGPAVAGQREDGDGYEDDDEARLEAVRRSLMTPGIRRRR